MGLAQGSTEQGLSQQGTTQTYIISDGGGGGNTTYVYVAYADDANGTGFSLQPTATSTYFAIKYSPTVIDTPVAADFTGYWTLYREQGLPGDPGDPGEPGAPGNTPYVHVAYASSDTGADFSLTPLPNSKYMSIVAVLEQPDPAQVPISEFNGRWVKIFNDAPTGGTAPAVTEISMGQQQDFSYAIDLAVRPEIVLVRDGTAGGTVNFRNVPSKGTAVVGIKAPLEGTIQPLGYDKVLSWIGTPPDTNTAGRGDVALFRSWDGKTVQGVVSDRNILFEAAIPIGLAGMHAVYRFLPGAPLADSLFPAKNAFIINEGTLRSPYGIDFASGQNLYTAGFVNPNNDVAFDWNGPWSVGFLAPFLYDNVMATTGQAAIWGAGSTGHNSNYIRIYTKKHSVTGLPIAVVSIRDATYSNGIVGTRDANNQETVYLRIPQANLNYLILQHDGAGNYQFRDIKSGERFWDSVAGAFATGDMLRVLGTAGTTPLITMTNPLRLSLPNQIRIDGSTPIGTSFGFARHMYVNPAVIAAAGRAEMYGYVRDFVAKTDPTGPQLAAL